MSPTLKTCTVHVVLLIFICELVVFLILRESEPVTICWMKAGEECCTIKQDNKGKLVTHTYETPPLAQNKPTEQLPSGVCVSYTYMLKQCTHFHNL